MKTAIIGGDKRMLFAAKAFLDDGAEVAVAGFDDLQSICDIRVLSIREAVQWADFSVLPIRPLKDGLINCPYSREQVSFSDFSALNANKPVFCGNAAVVSDNIKAPVYDYAAREAFLIQNAVLTAEGALELLLREYEDSLFGAETLLLGYGRIGKVLLCYLKGLGAKVTVAARKPSDREWIRTNGVNAADYSSLELKRYQIIINTVPARIFSADEIAQLNDDIFLVDLASAPGGYDFQCIRERGLTCFHALGLPGKSAPKAAGRIIKDTVITIIKEENGGKEHFGLCDDRLLLHL